MRESAASDGKIYNDRWSVKIFLCMYVIVDIKVNIRIQISLGYHEKKNACSRSARPRIIQ